MSTERTAAQPRDDSLAGETTREDKALHSARKYSTILADPPWGYEGYSPPWRSSIPGHYPLMSLEEIKVLPVADLAAKDCHLYLWAVLPLLEDAYEVIRCWGFKPSTVVTWCKRGPGLGAGWRGNTEHLLVARRGSAPFLAGFAGPGTWHVASRGGEHSRKPELFMDLIEQASPEPRLEMFSRRARLGWDTWGNESLHGMEAVA